MDILSEIAKNIENNNIEKALDLIESNSNKYQKNSEFWNMKGIVCIKAGENDTAVKCLKKAAELDKNDVDAIYNLAYGYELEEDYYDALRMYNAVLEETDDINLKNGADACIKRIKKDELSNYDVIVRNTDSIKSNKQYEDNVYLSRNYMINATLGDNAPLVSIIVLAYNNLEKYTKTCIDCILKYTKNVNYELILVDNGTQDGTFEYFKSVPYKRKKVIRLTNNTGGCYGISIGFAYSSGRYISFIPNDVFVTSNWLLNLLKCTESDERIGMVTPVCSYASNYQMVDLKYKNFEDMQSKAKVYNISNPKKWEERLRLITLGTLYKRECIDIAGFSDYGFLHDFSDDDITFRIRRAGYKTILCRDTFVCHAGKINDKGDKLAAEAIEKGRDIFKNKYHGIDAWSDVCNYESSMMSILNVSKTVKSPNALGIDVLCGTPILELKNKLRNSGIFDTKLYAFSCDAKYWTDLKTICEGEVAVDRIQYLSEHFNGLKFDYIILGNPINEYENPYKLLRSILKILDINGQLLIKFKNSYSIKSLLQIIGNNFNNKDNDIRQIPIEDLALKLEKYGYCINKTALELYSVDENVKKILKKGLNNFSLVKNFGNTFEKMLVDNYVISIVKK